MKFIRRQHDNLKRLLYANRIAATVPEAMRTADTQEIVAIESNPCRCIRCGNPVNPAVRLPAPFLCVTCQRELMAADRAQRPGAVWWKGFLETARASEEPRE